MKNIKQKIITISFTGLIISSGIGIIKAIDFEKDKKAIIEDTIEIESIDLIQTDTIDINTKLIEQFKTNIVDTEIDYHQLGC
jgi:hypothetical protein